MLNSLISFFNISSPNEPLKHKNSNGKNRFVYRDKMIKIKPTKKGENNNSDSKPLIKGTKTSSNPKTGIQEEKSVMRVKVMMTKREANRLLSRCKYGGSLEFGDVAREIVDLPSSRVTVLDLSSSCNGVTVLKTIPEE